MSAPKVTFNTTSVEPNRVLKEKFKHEVTETETFNLTDDEKVTLKVYLRKTKTYLEKVTLRCKKELEHYPNSEMLKPFAPEGADALLFEEKPFDFLNKAYTVQTFHKDESKNQNRSQSHIDTGTNFTKGYKSPSTLVDMEKIQELEAVYEVGTLLAIFNNLLSQMSRIEAGLEDNEKDPEELAAVILGLPRVLKALAEEVEKSPILNTGWAANLKTDFIEFLQKFITWLNDLKDSDSDREHPEIHL